jgi:chromosome partitioning protein
MSLVGELGRERFLADVVEPIRSEYDDIIIDTPPNLGLLTVNALVTAEIVIAPVSAEDDASLYGIRELRGTLRKLTERLDAQPPVLLAALTRWQPLRVSSRQIAHCAHPSDGTRAFPRHQTAPQLRCPRKRGKSMIA